MTVEVACPSELSGPALAALTSLEEPGAARSIGAPMVSRLVGGCSWSTPPAPHEARQHLLKLVQQATATQTKPGTGRRGTVPERRPAWPGRSTASPSSWTGRRWPTWPGRPPWRGRGRRPFLEGIVVRALADGGRSHGPSRDRQGDGGHGKADRGMEDRPGRPSPLMVAFGPAEAEALNAAARPAGLPAPAGRTASWSSASAPTPWRRGPGPAAYRPDSGGYPGHRVGLGERGSAVEVEWRGPAGTSTSKPATSLPRRRCPGTSLVQDVAGRARARPLPRVRVRHHGPLPTGLRAGPRRPAGTATPWHWPPGRARHRRLGHPGRARYPGRRDRRPGGAAAGPRPLSWPPAWPDAAMLEQAGPRPLSPVCRRRWAQEVTAAAVERDLGLPARARPDRVLGRPTGGSSRPPPGRRPGPTLGL